MIWGNIPAINGKGPSMYKKMWNKIIKMSIMFENFFYRHCG
jgi:hypothetical protein